MIIIGLGTVWILDGDVDSAARLGELGGDVADDRDLEAALASVGAAAPCPVLVVPDPGSAH
jgi:hypothetical protein